MGMTRVGKRPALGAGIFAGSNPATHTKKTVELGSRQTQGSVKPSPLGFVGANPTSTTIIWGYKLSGKLYDLHSYFESSRLSISTIWRANLDGDRGGLLNRFGHLMSVVRFHCSPL